jgi:DNA-binding response OmpR family regulator
MAGERGPAVLVVSGDSAVRGATNSVLPLAGWRVQDVPSYTLAMHNLKIALPDVLMLDQKFQEGDALQLIKAVRYLPGHEDMTIALMVESIDRTMAVQYVRAGIQVFLAKPLNIVDVCDKLAEQVSAAGRIEPPPPEEDPLARPMVVLATPNLNFKEMAEKALLDEYELLFFDGVRGVDAERRAASIIIVDEGLPGGLDALPNWRVLFGQDAVAVSMTTRGGDAPNGYAAALVKPVRDTALRRTVRQYTDRERYGIFPMQNGVVVRIRDGWHALTDSVFEEYLMNIDEIAELTKETGRKWLCIDGPYIGAPEQIPRTRALYEAAERPGLHVGVVTLQSDTSRVALHCNIRPIYVHNKTAEFIKAVQDLA